MSFKLANRVKERSDTVGTGDINLTGAVSSFQTFSSALNNGDTTFYVVEDVNNWEVGYGIYTSNTIVRDTIISSSNSDSPINLTGSSFVSLTYPSERSVYLNESLNTVAGSGLVFTNDNTILKTDGGDLYWGDTVLNGGGSGDNATAIYASGIAEYASGQVAPNQSDAFSYINTDSIQFDTAASPTLSQGEIGWNDTFGTLDVGMTETYALHIGEETHFRVRNINNDTIYKGQPVYASGIHSDNTRLLISKYVADGSVPEIRFIGLVTETLAKNASGYTTNFGYIKGVDTRGNVASPIAVGDETWQVGDILYVHPTQAGKLTKVAPKHSISVAIIMYVHQNEGLLLVRPTEYGHLGDSHDVDTTGVSNNQYLKYDSSNDLWSPTSSGIFNTLTLSLQENTDSSTITFDMGVSNIHTVTLEGNRTLAVSNATAGQIFIARLTQDAIGSRTVNWFSGISWPSGNVPVLTTTQNKTDVFCFICTGSGTYDGFVMGSNM